MTRFNSSSVIIAGILCLTAIAFGETLAIAAPSVATAISTRQASFKKMGAAMKTLKDELGGSGDSAKMLTAAKTIATAGRQQGALFPAGSGAASGVKTDALPAIWTDRATFDADMKKMIAEADKLVVVAGSGNMSAIAAQFKATGATCGSCHRQFRADD